MLATYKEEKTIEVRGHSDVIVVGGGPSGVAAAISAARHGASVTMIEKSTILGGLATSGLVIFYEPLCDGNGRQVCGGLAEEFLYRSIEYSYSTLPARWERGLKREKDPELFKDPDDYPLEVLREEDKRRYQTLYNYAAFALALEESALKEGVNILYDTLFCDAIIENKRCTGVIVENISGRYAISCNALIDASGSCAAFYSTGAKCRSIDNKFIMEFLDTDFDKMKEAIKTNQVRKAINWRMIGHVPLAQETQTSMFRGDTIESENEFIRYGHAVALDHLKANQRPDYAMLTLPTMPQFRYIRQIEGRKPITKEDIFKRAEDSIGCVSDWRKAGPIFEIPYSCMLAPELKNMAAVGRNVACDDDLWDILRCYPGAVTTGQAAGTAAALALKTGVDLEDVDIALLQKTLAEDGIIIHQESI